ncbi:MAG: acyltransferase [Bacteroidales bacterium]|nr:acyltransferase [Bacteroidales bacterium]
MSRQHITYFDFLRGIAILMVIGIHTYVAGDFFSVGGTIRIILRQLLNCAVPVFLALSAFFLGRKRLDTRNFIISFWKKQIPKVYIPCIIWSVPLFALMVMGGKNVVNELVRMLICGYSIYYFIALIIQYYLLLPLLQKYPRSFLDSSVIISAVSIIIITYLTSIKGLQLPLIIYAGPFVTWFVFYMLGVYYSMYDREYSLKSVLWLILIGFVLECLETYFLNTNYGGGVGIKLSSFIFSYGIILFVLSPKTQALYKDNKFTSFIAYVGKISFGLYLTHCYVITVVKNIFPISSWFISFCVVSILTILLVMLSRKILPQYINKYLGF